ncbi:DNA-binding response regulator in two-component regulatory system with KdpD [Candidatus Methylobacter favarea]|uniref:DNA-binding response regulator in two-component regulatory system with KdpD n=1 Tax=Candidatus Methylobacter favarea TaxID=2707345 RepID=A0A8S0X9G6_9GAMM|nr:response regulator [Candidatus Methylobacter favarea]CAA9892246.1 DNA-binding response regulator in two-component regulatory system with KdpD [Candidatus Methylobacter favarea]
MTKAKAVIVAIEDDPQICRFLRTSLNAHGFQLFEAATGERGLVEIGTRQPELVILDLGLPGMDGIAVIRWLRGWSNLPIIVLSARSQESDKIAALDAGADDYLTKPFSIGELLARIRVSLRHAAQLAGDNAEPLFTTGELRVDLASRRVCMGNREIRLTPIEYRLLTVLIHHAGKVLTHRFILLHVWGPAYVEHAHYVRIYMGQLRQKLEADPTHPKYLLTETGIGYRLMYCT